jgi:hypothetical protein
MPASKIIIITPGSTSDSIQEVLDGLVLPGQTNFEVLLPPESSQKYDNLADMKKTWRKVRFVASPARRFFSSRHLGWLRGKFQSSENVMVVIRQSPYEDITSAMASLLIMLLSGKTITLLRTITPAHKPIIDLEGQNSGDRVISKELNLRALGKQYTQLFPTIWEVLYFFMFLFLVIKRLLIKKCS